MAVLRQWKLEFGECPEPGRGAAADAGRSAAGPESAARGAESAARRTANQELHAVQWRRKARRRGRPQKVARTVQVFHTVIDGLDRKGQQDREYHEDRNRDQMPSRLSRARRPSRTENCV